MQQRHTQVGVVLSSLGMLCLGFLLLPLCVLAQGTVPITVIFQFGNEVSLGASCVPRTTLCDPERSSFALFNEIVLPSIETKVGQESREAEEREQRLRRSRLFGGQIRYERVDLSNQTGRDLDGDIYSTNLKMLWEIEDFSFGFLIPYDFMDLDSLNVHRIGTVAFGQYDLDLRDDLTLGFTVNGNYLHTAIDTSDIDDVNTFGGGVSASLTLDRDLFVFGGAVSYQFHADDSDRDNNKQHLLKIGTLAGLRLGDRAAVTLFSTLNYDATDYTNTLREVDDTYFDLGFEVAWSLSSTWHLTGGYKKVLGLEDFDSDMVFLGTLLRF